MGLLDKFFSFRKRASEKYSQLTNQEISLLIQLREAFKIDELLAQIQNWCQNRQFDLDSQAMLVSIEIPALFLKGMIDEELNSSLNQLKEKEHELRSIQSIIALNFVYSLLNQLLFGKIPENGLSFEKIIQQLSENEAKLDKYYQNWIYQMVKGLLGWMHINSGDYESAYKFSIEAYIIAKENNWNSSLIAHINSLGVYYHEINEYDMAIEKYKEVLHLPNPTLSLSSSSLICAKNLAEIYLELGRFDESLTLAKDVRGRAQKSKNYMTWSASLQLIIKALLESGSKNEIDPYMTELETLIKIPEASVKANYDFKCAKANILVESPKLADLIQAQTIYADLIKNTSGMVISFDLDFALVNLVVKEIKITGNEARFSDLERILSELKEKVRQQRSLIYIIETHLLESKIAAINKDLQKAQMLLDQSLKLAREKNLQLMIYKVSREYDHFLEEKQNWENVYARSSTLKERIEFAKLDETIDQVLHKNVTIENIPEKPLYLFILGNTGITIYSHTFLKDQPIDENLVGGFLSAINTFCQEMFASKGYLERVKYQDYTILLESIGNMLMCCYVIQGDSFLASQRLKRFTDSIEKGSLYPEFLKVQESGNLSFDQRRLKELINDCFTG